METAKSETWCNKPEYIHDLNFTRLRVKKIKKISEIIYNMIV